MHDRSQVPGSIVAVLPIPEANTTRTGPVTTKASTCTKETHAREKHEHEFLRKNMSSSGKIRVPAEEYVIYYPLTDQSDSRITLNLYNSSLLLLLGYYCLIEMSIILGSSELHSHYN